MQKQIWLAAIATLAACLPISHSHAQEQPARPELLVHYMPWFESKDISKTWGWHWSMNHFDPEHLDASGKRNIASHYYPLIGPYDSHDPDLLEYHTLLMKTSGIDGVIADWYGSEAFNDYAIINRNTSALFESLKRRNMKFAVCYEDRVLKAIAEKQNLTREHASNHAITHLKYAQEHWFHDPAYVKLQGKPLLLVFGPDYLETKEWQTVFATLKEPLSFLTLHERKPPATGSFSWPPMWKSKDGKLDANDLDAYLNAYEKRDEPKIASAFPGFHDIYQQAGVQPSNGYLDARDGATFRHTLTRAIAAKTPLVQIVTWNDFGEGTCIEPSREYGYQYLETIQNARQQFPGTRFPYTSADLRLPLRIYQLRKKLAPKSAVQNTLNEAADALFAADSAKASRILDRLEAKVSDPPMCRILARRQIRPAFRDSCRNARRWTVIDVSENSIRAKVKTQHGATYEVRRPTLPVTVGIRRPHRQRLRSLLG